MLTWSLFLGLLFTLIAAAQDTSVYISAPAEIAAGSPTKATIEVEVHNGAMTYCDTFRVYLGASAQDESAAFYSSDCYLMRELSLCDTSIDIASNYVNFKSTSFTVNIPSSIGPSGPHYVLMARILNTDGSYYGAELYSDVFNLTGGTGAWGMAESQGYTLWGDDGIACTGYACVRNCSDAAYGNNTQPMYQACANSCPNVSIDFESSTYGGYPTASLTKPTACSRDRSNVQTFECWISNNGGYILSAYDLFRQLFPKTEQVGLTRFRNNQIQETAVKVNQKIVPADFDPTTASSEQINAYEESWNYRYDLDIDGQHFTSAESKFADHPYKQSNFSSLVQWDLNDKLTTVDGPLAFGTNITGYGNRTNFSQPFAAENIIMLTDGFCASSCFLFSDFMKHQGHVKSIAVGGRPNTNPMQAVGGVKGGQLSTWYNLYLAVYRDEFALWAQNMSDVDAAFLKQNWVDHNEFQGFTATAGVNLRDVIQQDHVQDGVPAQFVHEDADCRLFYTRDMIIDVTNVWKKVVGAAWDGDKCVAGGLSKRTEATDGRLSSKETRDSGVSRAATGTKRVVVQEETISKDAAWRMKHGQRAFE